MKKQCFALAGIIFMMSSIFGLPHTLTPSATMYMVPPAVTRERQAAHSSNSGHYNDVYQGLKFWGDDIVSDLVSNLFQILRLNYQPSQEGHGLVGAAVDPRYAQSVEVGPLTDFGYDTARDISRIATALSALLSLFVGCYLMAKRRYNWRKRTITIVIMLLIPTLVHLCGTFAINNYGGLGGCGL